MFLYDDFVMCEQNHLKKSATLTRVSSQSSHPLEIVIHEVHRACSCTRKQGNQQLSSSFIDIHAQQAGRQSGQERLNNRVQSGRFSLFSIQSIQNSALYKDALCLPDRLLFFCLWFSWKAEKAAFIWVISVLSLRLCSQPLFNHLTNLFWKYSRNAGHASY